MKCDTPCTDFRGSNNHVTNLGRHLIMNVYLCTVHLFIIKVFYLLTGALYISLRKH